MGWKCIGTGKWYTRNIAEQDVDKIGQCVEERFRFKNLIKKKGNSHDLEPLRQKVSDYVLKNRIKPKEQIKYTEKIKVLGKRLHGKISQ